MIFSMLGLSSLLHASPPGEPIGMFDGHDDVGVVLRPGAVRFDIAARAYTITSGGEDM